MDALEIRRFTPADRDEVIRITKEAWGDVTMAELRERRFGIIGGKNWREHKAQEVIAYCDRQPETCLIAEIDGVVVGYATFAFGVNRSVGIVGDNAVDPKWQRRGIGTRLIQRVIEELEKADVEMLQVMTLEHDTPARKVYERLGFEEIARTVHYTRPVGGED